MCINLEPRPETISKTSSPSSPIHYSLARQFLKVSALLTTYANDLKTHHTELGREDIQERYFQSIVNAVIYSAAALKAEINDAIYYGPGYHLRAALLDATARQVLWPLSRFKDKTLPTLQQYNMALRLLNKPEIDKASLISQNATMLIGLMDIFVAYKSTWDAVRDRRRLFEELQPFGRQQVPVGFQPAPFFPDASLGRWCVQTAVAYINAFYARLELTSPLRPDATSLAGLWPAAWVRSIPAFDPREVRIDAAALPAFVNWRHLLASPQDLPNSAP